MNNSDLSSSLLNDNWQILAERKLSAEASLDAEVTVWLMEVLHPIPLHTDLLHRILRSALDAAARAFQPGPGMKFEHVHLRVFGPQEYPSNETTWGFFRIEKVGTPSVNRNKYDHSIEFYLYLEG